MKTPIFISSLFFIISASHAQYNPVTSMQTNFKDIATFSKNKRQSGFESVQTYSNNDVRGSQFFYPSFENGSVTTLNNEVIANLYQFLFDKVRQELFIISRDDKRDPPEILLADKSQVKTFTITTNKDHVFVPAANYFPDNKNDFFEVLDKDDSAFTLLKYVKTTYVKMNSSDILRMRRGEMYDEFIDEVTYYLSFRNGKPQLVNLKQKSITNAFPAAKKEAVQDYFRTHGQEEYNEQFLINIVDAMNK